MHQVRLTGEEGLVDLEARSCDQTAVDDELIAAAHDQEVSDDDLAGVELALDPGADDARRRPREDGDAVQDALGTDLLEEAHGGVGEHHPDGDERVEVAAQ